MLLLQLCFPWHSIACNVKTGTRLDRAFATGVQPRWTPGPPSQKVQVHFAAKAWFDSFSRLINLQEQGPLPASTIRANNNQCSRINHHLNPTTIMADGAGIDRKADEKIQFSTSKEVTVHPTFESMSLKGASQITELWRP